MYTRFELVCCLLLLTLHGVVDAQAGKPESIDTPADSAVAHWLADHGIAAFVLKYRLRPTASSNEEFHKELITFFRNLREIIDASER